MITAPLLAIARHKRKNYSVVLTCVATGEGSYIKGTVACDYVKHGGKCESCSLRDSYPDEFR